MRRRKLLPKVLVGSVVGLVYLFLLAPVIVVAGASFDGGKSVAGRAFLQFPPSDLTLYWYENIQPRLWEALGVSVSVAAVAATVGTVLGVPAALGIVRSNLPGKTLIATLFRAPLQIPFIVIGIAFLQTYYFFADAVGFGLQGTFAGLALGHVFVATPYVVGSVGAALQRFDVRLEEAALSLGANRLTTFRRVTLPIIMPGIYAGALFAFMVSFGDVPISLFLASATYTTLPLEIFHGMEFDFDAAVLAISTVVLLGSLVVLYFIQRIVGLDVLLRSGGNG
ncbi:MAG: ABC transporter permease [Alphaproteobacteria bacterium]|nr:ABC transporter permease [Alphaproteobacteria bacterium]MCY4496652.1 ABC transporter permease [Rhodospirillaceae bacterium]